MLRPVCLEDLVTKVSQDSLMRSFASGLTYIPSEFFAAPLKLGVDHGIALNVSGDVEVVARRQGSQALWLES